MKKKWSEMNNRWKIDKLLMPMKRRHKRKEKDNRCEKKNFKHHFTILAKLWCFILPHKFWFLTPFVFRDNNENVWAKDLLWRETPVNSCQFNLLNSTLPTPQNHKEKRKFCRKT